MSCVLLLSSVIVQWSSTGCLSTVHSNYWLSLSRLLTMCTRHFGSVVAQTIRLYKTDQFPLLLIVMGKRTSNEVLNVIQGKIYVNELLIKLYCW